MAYYDERKWCRRCRQYVRFLRSYEESYCVRCGGHVVLFNRKDMNSFRKTIKVSAWPKLPIR